MASRFALPRFALSGKRAAGAGLAIFLGVAAVAAYMNNRETEYRARYLAQDRENFSGVLRLLDKGGSGLPPTGGVAREALDELLVSAKKMLADVQTLEKGRPGLLKLGALVAEIESGSIEFRHLTRQWVESAQGTQKEPAIRFALSAERAGRGAARVWVAEVSPEQLAALSMATVAAGAGLSALPATDFAVQRLAVLFAPYRDAIGLLNAQSRTLAEAKNAARSISGNIDLLLAKSQLLNDAYQSERPVRIFALVALLSGALALLLLMLLIKVYFNDARRRAEAAEKINRCNQQAILRLMNELSELADGNLTVRATVAEDITGAIADSVNYTADELCKLVTKITFAADQMGDATGHAGRISRELLEATRKQAEEIRATGERVQWMTESIREVDSSAAKAAEVGQRTLAAAERGGRAVRDSIAGMDVICEQIQGTSKRIKRLGESSQEIGEIVDLISDITEQTNVLALNAAIQATSVDEAGRGFSTVAEEVQRLAERSAEAAGQIGALVKTIQSDTQDAVAAMERTTMGVVEGAKLSDVTGQALQEIEQVSRELAALINGISVSTGTQTDMAGQVAESMLNIMQITRRTTDCTSMTANSIDQLTHLSTLLKGSVARFRLQN